MGMYAWKRSWIHEANWKVEDDLCLGADMLGEDHLCIESKPENMFHSIGSNYARK